MIDRVAKIIDGHDTRAHARSPEDELVKDADALWRFSVAGIAITSDWFGLTPGEYADRTEPQIEGRLFTETARTIARAELADTRRVLRCGELAADSAREDHGVVIDTGSLRAGLRAGRALLADALQRDPRPRRLRARPGTRARQPEADADIVLPAILLHDIGYMAVPAEDHLKGLAGAVKGWEPEITRRHEIQGAALAGKILAGVGWDAQRTRRSRTSSTATTPGRRRSASRTSSSRTPTSCGASPRPRCASATNG